MRTISFELFIFAVNLGVAGCSGSNTLTPPGDNGVGGSTEAGSSSTEVGGAAQTGGKSGTAVPPTGGAPGNAGAATCGNITSTCTEANKTLSANGIGKHCNYTYEYWKDSGSGSLILEPYGFSVNWSGINNLLGRKGIRPGSKNLSVTYDANYQPNGNSYLCVYGWTRKPLIEYYIVDSWGSWKPPGGTSLGTVSCDGGTYDIYKTQRVNQPSIDGTQTFYQFWSVRTAKRTCGAITVGCHFDAWAAKGLSLGTFYEVSMSVEGYQSSGTADVKMSIK